MPGADYDLTSLAWRSSCQPRKLMAVGSERSWHDNKSRSSTFVMQYAPAASFLLKKSQSYIKKTLSLAF